VNQIRFRPDTSVGAYDAPSDLLISCGGRNPFQFPRLSTSPLMRSHCSYFLYKVECLYARLFVIDKLGPLTVYPTYNTYSESA